jgi:hypothetical protein
MKYYIGNGDLINIIDSNTFIIYSIDTITSCYMHTSMHKVDDYIVALSSTWEELI